MVNFRAEVYAKARNTGKGRKHFLHRSRDWRMFFSGRHLDFVQMETFAIFYTSMPRDAVRLWKEVRDAKRSHLEQVSSSVPKVKGQTDVKSSNSPTTRVENSLSSMVDKMKITSCDYRHHPVCRGYKSGNRCICRCLYRHADGEK